MKEGKHMKHQFRKTDGYRAPQLLLVSLEAGDLLRTSGEGDGVIELPETPLHPKG